MKRRWFAIAAMVALPLLGASPHAYAVHLPSNAIGRPLPDVPVTALSGAPASLAVPGRWVYVDLFATWCGPCNQEMPTVERDAKAYRTSVTFVGLDEREGPGAVEAFLKGYPTAFARVFVDPPDLGLPRSSWQYAVYGPHGAFGALQAAYQSNMLPGGILIDPRGVVRAVWAGYSGSDELAAHLRALGIHK